MSKIHSQRRQFLKSSLAFGGASLLLNPSLKSWQQFSFINQAQAMASTDYKALVCVMLAGGNDSANMLIPDSESEYTLYSGIRQSLAIPKDNLLSITPATTNAGGSYSLHPSLGNLKTLFDQGKLSFVSNVGPMIEAVSKTNFENNNVVLPPHLFSHSDQQSHWQTADPLNPAPSGWAGVMADKYVNPAGSLPCNLTVAGFNEWQKGNSTVPYGLNSGGITQYSGLSGSNRNDLRAQALKSLLSPKSDDALMVKELIRLKSRSLDLADNLSTELAEADTSSPITTPFPSDNSLASQLKTVARMIRIQSELGAQRQTFFVKMGGFDTHANQETLQPILFEKLASALLAFQNTLQETNMADHVTTFTISDFGRTLTSNGDGTDHGWGGHQIIMGNQIKGGDIFGRMPEMALDSDDSVKRGRFIPQYSVDQYGATLASWYGMNTDQLNEIFPNLKNFTTKNLNFMS